VSIRRADADEIRTNRRIKMLSSNEIMTAIIETVYNNSGSRFMADALVSEFIELGIIDADIAENFEDVWALTGGDV
jgi:hypothetical protein